MQFRLRTSAKTANDLKYLQTCTNLNPNVLARLAIALSLLDPLSVEDGESNSAGLEFQRATLTGSKDILYKALIIQHAGRRLTDEEYFPDYIKRHLDRGCALLMNEYKYAGNYERMIQNLACGN